MSLSSATILLFFVIDPLGNIPMFLVALREVDPRRRNRVLVRELLIALGVLLVALLGGQYVLRVFHISDPSLSIAGGVILFLIALRMVFPSRDSRPADFSDSEPFIVPLAVPYLAGPSAVATVILLSTREPDRRPEWLLAVVLAWLASGIVLYSGASLNRLLSPRGLIAVERLMGLLLTTIAVQMTLTGIESFLRLIKIGR